ncbi:MAG: polysaccharide deacetylase family protein [Chitinophagaceae bacterium]|nr:polysaccharide deacetylase family protein [Chitinophagaceae bacterium]
MLLVYTASNGPRLQYIVNFFSDELFDRPIRITTSEREYLKFDGPKLNYSRKELCADEFIIYPVNLLFEKDVTRQDISCFETGYGKAFFETGGDFQFDIFAASFYLITRYEEYLPHEKDEYGRYAHTSSLAYREAFLNQPLVNTWLQEFRAALVFRFPGIRFKGRHFENIITYDIDIAYSYLCKGWLRNIGGTLRSILKNEWNPVFERLAVLAGFRKDPFDCYEWLDALHLYCRIKPYYFFLVPKNNSQYDKNVSTSSKRFKELVEYYCATYNVGIHPSWQSGDDSSLLREEIEWLEVVGDKTVQASRQHYIRLTLPETYRKLLAAGIKKDFSMGYGSINGFRASVSSPFKWYDLAKDQATSLTVYPFCFMDANSFYEAKQSPSEAFDELMAYYNAVKKVNGMLVTIWHNSLLGSDKNTAGWSRMFEIFMKEMVYWDAYYDGSSVLRQDVLFTRVLP